MSVVFDEAGPVEGKQQVGKVGNVSGTV